MYHCTVLAAVPSIIAVAVSNGGPSTRCGGLLASVSKKSLPAAIAEAAVSSVAAIVPRLAVSVVCKIPRGDGRVGADGELVRRPASPMRWPAA